MKKFTAVLLVLVIAGMIISLAGCDKDVVYGEKSELIQYGSFESSVAENHWKSKYSSATVQKVTLSESTDSTHKNVGKITAAKSDYAYMYQTIAVNNSAIYRLTIDIKVTTVTSSKEDAVSVRLSTNVHSPLVSIGSGDNQWHTYEVYFKVTDGETADLMLCLGSETAKASGVAMFDNVSVQRVKSAPSGASVLKIKQYKAEEAGKSTAGVWYDVLLAVFTVVLCVAVYVAMRRFYAKESESGEDKALFGNSYVTLTISLVAAFLVRFLLSYFVFADSHLSAHLVETIKEVGKVSLDKVYTTDVTAAPGGMFIMWAVAKVAALLKVNTVVGIAVLASAPAVLAEVVTVYCIFALARKFGNEKSAGLYSLLYALLPLTFTVAAQAGYEISVLTMLVVLVAVMLLDKKYIGMFVFSTLAFLLTEKAIVIVPFVLTYAVYMSVKDREVLKKVCISAACSLAGWFLLSLPLNVKNPLNVFKVYWDLTFTSQICVDNAFNLYAIFGLNDGRAVNTAAMVLNALFMVAFGVLVICLYFKNRHRAEFLMLAGLFMIGVSTCCLNQSAVSLVPGLAMLLVYAIVSGDKRFYALFVAFATLGFVNYASLLNLQSAFGTAHVEVGFGAKNALLIVGSIVAVVLTGVYGWLAYKVAINDDHREIVPLYDRTDVAFKNWVLRMMGKEAL